MELEHGDHQREASGPSDLVMLEVTPAETVPRLGGVVCVRAQATAPIWSRDAVTSP